MSVKAILCASNLQRWEPDDIKQVEPIALCVHELENLQLISLGNSFLPVELENLQFISAVLSEFPLLGQMYWKNSSSAPRLGQKCKNGLEKFQFILGTA
ncbi:hypothetical protein [Paenibacillus ferrarius]|uniref:hypothetical protein n=1 Tax=Paenibacillus ferrarius TaxID=1469647 RepID=UPI003D2C45E0